MIVWFKSQIIANLNDNINKVFWLSLRVYVTEISRKYTRIKKDVMKLIFSNQEKIIIIQKIKFFKIRFYFIFY